MIYCAPARANYIGYSLQDIIGGTDRHERREVTDETKQGRVMHGSVLERSCWKYSEHKADVWQEGDWLGIHHHG